MDHYLMGFQVNSSKHPFLFEPDMTLCRSYRNLWVKIHDCILQIKIQFFNVLIGFAHMILFGIHPNLLSYLFGNSAILCNNCEGFPTRWVIYFVKYEQSFIVLV